MSTRLEFSSIKGVDSGSQKLESIFFCPDISPDEKERIKNGTEERYSEAVQTCIQRAIDFRDKTPIHNVEDMLGSDFYRDGLVNLRIAQILGVDVGFSSENQERLQAEITDDEVQEKFYKTEESIENHKRLQQVFDSLLFHKIQGNEEYTKNYLLVIDKLHQKFDGKGKLITPLSGNRGFYFEYLHVSEDKRSGIVSSISCDEVVYDESTKTFYGLRDGIVYGNCILKTRVIFSKIF